MAWLLDTNAWITYLKDPQSAVRARLEERTPQDIAVCSVVRAELLHGARKYGNVERRRSAVLALLAPYRSLPFDDGAADQYARIRHELETGGQIIGPNDLLIAAVCCANDCILVTSNTSEFGRVSGLRVEDWSRATLK